MTNPAHVGTAQAICSKAETAHRAGMYVLQTLKRLDRPAGTMPGYFNVEVRRAFMAGALWERNKKETTAP